MFRERPLILIADDESKIRRVVAANLERSGFDVCSGAGRSKFSSTRIPNPTCSFST